MSATEVTETEFLCDVSGGKLYKTGHVFEITPTIVDPSAATCKFCKEPENEINPFLRIAHPECQCPENHMMHIKCMIIFTKIDNTIVNNNFRHIKSCRTCKVKCSTGVYKDDSANITIRYDENQSNYNRWTTRSGERTTFAIKINSHPLVKTEVWYLDNISTSSVKETIPLLMKESYTFGSMIKRIEYSVENNNSNGKRCICEYATYKSTDQYNSRADGIHYKCSIPRTQAKGVCKSYLLNETEYSALHHGDRHGRSRIYENLVSKQASYITPDFKCKLLIDANYSRGHLHGSVVEKTETGIILKEYTCNMGDIDYTKPVLMQSTNGYGDNTKVKSKLSITPLGTYLGKNKIRNQYWEYDKLIHDLVQIVSLSSIYGLNREHSYIDVEFPNFVYYNNGDIKKKSEIVDIDGKSVVHVEEFSVTGKKITEYYKIKNTNSKCGLYREWYIAGQIKQICEYNNDRLISVYAQYSITGDIIKFGKYNSNGEFIYL